MSNRNEEMWLKAENIYVKGEDNVTYESIGKLPWVNRSTKGVEYQAKKRHWSAKRKEYRTGQVFDGKADDLKSKYQIILDTEEPVKGTLMVVRDILYNLLTGDNLSRILATARVKDVQDLIKMQNELDEIMKREERDMIIAPMTIDQVKNSYAYKLGYQDGFEDCADKVMKEYNVTKLNIRRTYEKIREVKAIPEIE